MTEKEKQENALQNFATIWFERNPDAEHKDVQEVLNNLRYDVRFHLITEEYKADLFNVKFNIRFRPTKEMANASLDELLKMHIEYKFDLPSTSPKNFSDGHFIQALEKIHQMKITMEDIYFIEPESFPIISGEEHNLVVSRFDFKYKIERGKYKNIYHIQRNIKVG